MIPGRKLGIPLLLAALLAPAAADAESHDISIIGRWQIVEAVPAPWSPEEERSALAAEGRRMIGLDVAFTPTAVNSKFKLFNCKRRVGYEAVELPIDTLFQGNLPEPNPAAEAVRLGFRRGADVPSVDVRCVNAKLTFHFRDRDTALFNLNRVVYTLKRR